MSAWADRATKVDYEPASTRRINAAAALLTGHPDEALRVLDKLEQDELANVAEAIRQIQRQRALARGDLDEIIGNAFEVGFGRDGLGLLPWTEGDVIVCPGGLVSKSRTNHRCRFVSVNDTWIWESPDLIREDKRSSPGVEDGFRAVALLPLMDGLELDVVSGKARAGQHSVDRVVSYEVRAGELIEVSQRTVSASGMQ
ncbi:MAG: hypothetical protein AAF467_24995 [Actinomycetota bacterium]